MATAGRGGPGLPRWRPASGAERWEGTWDCNGDCRGGGFTPAAGGLGALRRGAPSEGCRVRAAGTRGAAVGSRVCVKVASAESGVRCEEAGSQVWVGGRGQGLGLGRMVWRSHRGLCVRASARTGTLTAAAPMDGCVWSAQRTGRPGAGFRGRLGDASAGAPNQASPCASVHLSSQPATWGATDQRALQKGLFNGNKCTNPPVCPRSHPLVT